MDMTPEGAFRKLLGGGAGYSSIRPDLGSFSLDRISWPEVGSSLCDITELLPEADSIRLKSWESSMLRHGSLTRMVGPFKDDHPSFQATILVSILHQDD